MNSALSALKADGQGQDVNLTFPSGGTFNQASFSIWIDGMKDLNVTATGATLSGAGLTLQTSHIQQAGIDATTGGIDGTGGKNARIQTVSPGATSVTLTAASASAGHISRFSVGQWVVITGWPIQSGFQAPFGFPPNWHWCEHRQITNIVDDTIYFTQPLENYYSSSWPEMHRGNTSETDGGGPATVVGLNAAWGGTTTFNDGTYTRGDLINCNREVFIMNGGTSSNLPIYPTVNRIWRAIDHTATDAQVEHDKINDLVDVIGGTYSQWWVQSSSTRLLQMTGTAINGSLNGTPRNAVIDTCSIGGDLNIGPTSYGRGETFVCRNTSIAGTIGGGIFEKGPRDEGVQGCFSMSGGVITIPLSLGDSATRTMMPDASGRHVVFWRGPNGPFGSFQVLSVTSDTWPAVDDLSATTTVTMSSSSNPRNLAVSTDIFQASDVGKVILIPGAGNSSGTLATFITAFTDAQHVTVFDPCTTSVSGVSKTLRWGTCNMYVQTNQSGGLPSTALWGNGGTLLQIGLPAARSVTFDNVTGSPHALDLSQPAAQGRPLHSYSKRTYDGSFGFSGPQVQMLGNVVSLKVNVTKAYTGAQGTLYHRFSGFDNLKVVQADAYVNYTGRFNLKAVGERVITIGNTTGAQSGDSNIGMAVPTWLCAALNNQVNVDISGEDPSVWPSYTIEIITDQGFPTAPVAVAPLRLRLRAA